MSKKRKTYEIHVPVRQTWVFKVTASSKKEALAKYEADEVDEQSHSFGGWNYEDGDHPEAVRVFQVEGES